MADNTQSPLNDPYGDLDHQSRTYIALHDAMMKFYKEKKYKECVQLAERLLTEPALPDLFRARAHLILSLRKKSTSSVEHAEQAVTLIEGLRSLVTPEEFPQEELDQANRLLRVAQEKESKTEADAPAESS